MSSLYVQWINEAPAGRVYGQAWLDRRGTTVHFLRVRLCDDQGRVVATGMATSHLSG